MAAKKRLVFCFDGTSNTLDMPSPTNVAITAAAVRNSADIPQIVYYDEGVGSTKGEKLKGGAFGAGLYDKIIEAYKFLVFNYEPGDEIFIFGFSRGAYTARSFAGLIHHVGVVNSCYSEKIAVATALYQNRAGGEADFRDDLNDFRSKFVPDVCASDEDRAWRVENVPGFDPDRTPVVTIKYLGVWDTVKTIGSAYLDGDEDDDGEADFAEFHDHGLHPSVESARHAVALDERRKKFNVTLWDNVDDLNTARGVAVDDPERPYQQVWFPGTHGSVGGGGDIRGLSDEGLEWVLEGAKRAGLRLDVTSHSKIYGIRPDALAKLDNSSKRSWDIGAIVMRHLPRTDRNGPANIYEVSRSAVVRWAAPAGATPEGKQYRPRTLDKVVQGVNAAAQEFAPWMFASRGFHGEVGQADAEAYNGGDRIFRRHVIQPNETLETVAEGYGVTVDAILAVNKTTILDPDRYYAWQVINIPT